MTDRYEESPMKKLAAFFYEDEIERLNGEIKRLREALENLISYSDLPQAERNFDLWELTIAHARSALEEKE